MAWTAQGQPIVRPKFHFTASSWINDPCAPGYDPWTRTYHLFYQCNPSSCEWGDMSWGHIVSKDMVTWTLAETSPALLPDQAYDRDGVFTGCWVPSVDASDRKLRVAYSSVKQLPFHWSTPPYPRNAAGIAMATSSDGGITWIKSSRNPVLTGEPEGFEVTGFRDPFVTKSLSLDKALGNTEPTLYGLVSGGIEGKGPTTFLYKIPHNNLEDWKCLGPLVDIPSRFQPSNKWSGNYGINWECTNIVTLENDSEAREFLIIGAEGDVEKEHVSIFGRPEGLLSRTVRAQLWMSGHLTGANGRIKFKYEHGGYLDHGPYYAANSFLDEKTGRRIVYGWIPEEDIHLATAKEKGWNGSLAIPREIFLLRIPRVHGALRSRLSDMAPFEVKNETDGSTTLLTLGVRPISELVSLREVNCEVLSVDKAIALPESVDTTHKTLFQTQSASWELETTIAVHAGCETVGLHLRHNEDLSIRTTVIFSIVDESITVVRGASSTNRSINKCPDAGPFTLLTRAEESGDSEPTLEKLHLRVFSDGDILEVFANDRFALATMVYSESYGQEFGGISAFATGKDSSAVIESLRVWDGLGMKV